MQVNPGKLAALIADVGQLAADLTRAVPGAIDEREAARLTAEGLRVAGDVEALFAAPRAPVDHSAMRLGKLRGSWDARTLLFANYVRTLQAPARKDWGRGIAAWPMMQNDRIGDCTCAAGGHLIQEWTTDAGRPFVPSDEEILAAYKAVSGYDGTPETDRGAVLLDVLKFWRATGIGGRKIAAYAEIERDRAYMQSAVYLFGGAYIGLELPLSAQRQRVWSLTNGPDAIAGSWGGHCVPVVGYDAHGLVCVTWGETKRMTWQFFERYCDEAWAVLSPDWLETTGDSVSGFDLATLRADLAKLG